MLGKLLLTAFVIVLAFTLIRQKGIRRGLQEGLLERDADKTAGASAEQTSSRIAAQKNASDSSFQSDLRLGAYLFLVLMTGLGGALYYYDWQDDRAIITVTLYRSGELEPVSYEVYKYQLGERSFVTTDGVSVTVAASERMEIVGLND